MYNELKKEKLQKDIDKYLEIDKVRYKKETFKIDIIGQRK